MILDDRLAMAALRGVVQELEGDPAGAGEVLARMLSRIGPAPVVDRDVKPANIERPAPRRQRAKRSRPVLADDASGNPARSVEPEAAALVRAIEARHGMDGACARFGLNREVLRRWRGGAACSVRSLERLRIAAETAPYSSRRTPDGPEVDAAPEAALHEPAGDCDAPG